MRERFPSGAPPKYGFPAEIGSSPMNPVQSAYCAALVPATLHAELPQILDTIAVSLPLPLPAKPLGSQVSAIWSLISRRGWPEMGVCARADPAMMRKMSRVFMLSAATVFFLSDYRGPARDRECRRGSPAGTPPAWRRYRNLIGARFVSGSRRSLRHRQVFRCTAFDLRSCSLHSYKRSHVDRPRRNWRKAPRRIDCSPRILDEVSHADPPTGAGIIGRRIHQGKCGWSCIGANHLFRYPGAAIN